MNFDLHETIRDHILIVAHRGAAGGNIPCNTLPAYNAALLQGADMIETDVDITADGQLVVFHPRMERRHLNVDCDIRQMPWAEVKKLRYVNSDRTETQFGLLTFDELLETFKGRCYINVDKYWDNPEQICKAIRRHGMMEQCLVKSALSAPVLQVLEELSPELPFMPIVKETHPLHGELLKRNINYVGAEVLFKSEGSEMCSPAFIDRMHRDGCLVWANAIIYDYRDQLSAGHSDDTSLAEAPDKGWGWLADRGYDVIQTDWPLMLIDYLKKTGRYYR